MTSKRKRRRLDSKHVDESALKNSKGTRCKGVLFYTASRRKELKRLMEREIAEGETYGELHMGMV